MRNHEPLVSVVMPVFNGGAYLVDALASMVEQTFSDWEMICVNDGSSDGSGRVLDWFAQVDDRITVIHQKNAGIVDALNRGCAAAKGPLICRMDCDDLAMSTRIAQQVEHMQHHPECVVVGGAILEIDRDSDPLAVSRLANHHAEIESALLNRHTGHFHPTTMIRAEAMRAVSGYRAEYQWIEDHDLWLRLARRGELHNLDEVLLCYRQHSASVCWQRSVQQRELMNQLMMEAYRSRGKELPANLHVAGSTQRSAAGPGKWARAAAKGGFAASAKKHLRELRRTEARSAYKVRMHLEVALRLVAGVTRRTVRRLLNQKTLEVPQFDSWHSRIAKAGLNARARQAA